MILVPPVSPKENSVCSSSSSQFKQEIERQENEYDLLEGFTEKEMLAFRLESASSANSGLAAQLDFLKKVTLSWTSGLWVF